MAIFTRKKTLGERLLTASWRHKYALSCLLVALYLFSSAGYIHAKAIFAQFLIADAWQVTLQTTENTPPWSWADTYPVAKLTVADETSYVLAGATGRTLAFGPGHMSSTSLPGEQGNAVITGHRDTHFAVLEGVNVGDMIQTQTLAGSRTIR